jgi:hypothetical protein
MPSDDHGFETTSLPIGDTGPFRKAKVAAKAGQGTAIGALAGIGAAVAANAIIAKNPDMAEYVDNDALKQALYVGITGAAAVGGGIVSGFVNCWKNWWRRRYNKKGN